MTAAANAIEPEQAAVRAWFDNYRARQLPRLAFDLGLLRRLAPVGARVVDLGASPPVLSGAAVGIGYRVTGIDVAPERFAGGYASLGVTAVRCDIEREALPLPDGETQLVVLHEVFEHLRIDPVFVLREVARVLAPGGALMLSTPNLLSLRGALNLLLRGRAEAVGADPWREYGKLATIGHMGHVREYTTVEVCELLPHVGLQPEELVFRGRSRGVLRPFTSALPPLRPFFEVVARKRSVR